MHLRIGFVAAVLSLAGTAAQAQWNGHGNPRQPRTASRAYTSYRDYFSGIRQTQEPAPGGMEPAVAEVNEYRVVRGYSDYAYRYLDKYYFRPCGPSCCEPPPRHCCSPNCWTLWDGLRTLTDELLYGVLDPCCEKAPACCHGCRRRSLGLVSLFKGHWGGSRCGRCGHGYGGHDGCQSCGNGYYAGEVEELRPVPMPPGARLPATMPQPPQPAEDPEASSAGFSPQRVRKAQRPLPLKGPRT